MEKVPIFGYGFCGKTLVFWKQVEIYTVIQKDGLNFVRLYFLNCKGHMNDLHTVLKKEVFRF